jgi:hypothetical protein
MPMNLERSALSELRRKLRSRWRLFLRELDPMAAQQPVEGLELEVEHASVERASVPEPARTEPQRDPQPSSIELPSRRTRPRTLREDLLDPHSVRRAIVLREILDRPVALRARR